jgi:hypothetical protein
MRRFTILVLSIVSFYYVSGQNASAVKTLTWSDTLQNFEFSDYKLHAVLYFKGASYSEQTFGYLPYFFESVPMPSTGTATVTLVDEVYAPVVLKRGSIPQELTKLITNSPVISVSYGYEKKRQVVDISILPFRRNQNTGLPEKLVSFRYSLTVTPSGEAPVRGG